MVISGLAVQILKYSRHKPARVPLPRREEIQRAIRVKVLKQLKLALARDLSGKQLRQADRPLRVKYPEAERVGGKNRPDAGLGSQKGNLKPHAGQNTQLLSRQIQKP